ncbi:MAG TPA: thiamine pyrophosphate-binding protein [Casimicrobiaceae bacterium]|nr:thiamine pyrophosphate-binding protein [Casimicrobiaceae bacterium]
MAHARRSAGEAPANRNDDALERPVGAPGAVAQFGSDVVADTLRALRIPYIALNPGASFRGLHDSLVNHLGNRDPQMLLCLHEEHAVALAHGYAKVTGRAMAVAVHSNVGLFHASMAIFNAWCDRMPVLVLGATGPVDAPKRRPWIDWIHTARDQGAVVRPYVKFDDQPASPLAAREALLRAMWHAQSAPQGPVYVNLDAEMQESRLSASLPSIDVERYSAPARVAPSSEVIARAAELLRGAQRPLLLIGRTSRDVDAWNRRIQLGEALGARVATDLKVGAAFPTDHPLHLDAPSVMSTPGTSKAIAEADVILSLDWVDLAGTLKAACGGEPAARVIHVSLDHVLHNGWSMDHQGFPPADVFIAAETDLTVTALLCALESAAAPTNEPSIEQPRAATSTHATDPAGALTTDAIATLLRDVSRERPLSLLHLPLSWNAASYPFHHPLDYLGSDGGGGIGAGPGNAVGAALALRDAGSDRLPIAVCGDGDFLMGATALWTAAHYRVPLLLIVANNQSFYNDEVHQERMARMRGRPIENKWIGQRMSDPDIDLAGIARAQGAHAWGPIKTQDALEQSLLEAIAAVDAGRVAVIDVRVLPGYTPAMAGSLGAGAAVQR